MAQQLGEHHDWHSPEYVEKWIKQDASRDSQRRPMLRSTAALLPFASTDAVRVLDLGGGYGEFTRQLLDIFPHARVCLQDYAAPMLSHARSRLAANADQVEFVQCDLQNPQWPQELPRPFDAVISALVVHNLEPGTIQAIYRQVYDLLRPGGWFFNIDLVFDVELSPSPLAGLYARAARGGDSDGYERHDYDDSVHTATPTVRQHLEWLRQAGFSDADCPRKDFSEVFFAAYRTDG